MLWKIDNESGHPQLVQQDEVMKASTGQKCETQARAVHQILSGAVVKYPTKLNDISGTKAGFCVETVRRRIAEEIDLKKRRYRPAPKLFLLALQQATTPSKWSRGPDRMSMLRERAYAEASPTRRLQRGDHGHRKESRMGVASESWFPRAFRSMLGRQHSAGFPRVAARDIFLICSRRW